MDQTVIDWLVVVGVCLFAAVGAVAWLTPRSRRRHLSVPGQPDAVWLFDDKGPLDQSAAADAISGPLSENIGWDDLRATLGKRFADVPHTVAGPDAHPHVVSRARDAGDTAELVCEWSDGVARIEIRTDDPSRRHPRSSPDHRIPHAAADDAPYPVWYIDANDQITWSNAAYAVLVKAATGGDRTDGEPIVKLTPADWQAGRKKARKSVALANSDKKLWFDVSSVEHEDGRICYAVDVNAVVDGEVAQRNFVQTLAKTFAQLSIGLAIFDRNRQLVLFNPALIDLTALPADFLSARPTLLTFFDRLRDNRMMPEPKNYGSWRHQMAELVAAASDGRYQETWTLPSGSVYSVSGRPHPDGAIAFLIEDITAEITLTRRFRSELELNQSIMDQLDDAIAVFQSDGSMTFSNCAYHRMWDVDPDNSFAQTTILDAARVWQGRCHATPVWGDIRDFASAQENRAEWWANVALTNGQNLVCTVRPVMNGATMVQFTPFHAQHFQEVEARTI